MHHIMRLDSETAEAEGQANELGDYLVPSDLQLESSEYVSVSLYERNKEISTSKHNYPQVSEIRFDTISMSGKKQILIQGVEDKILSNNKNESLRCSMPLEEVDSIR